MLFSKKRSDNITVTTVIKNNASGEFLLHKYPEENFNTQSTLIVMPGEEAIFISGGLVVQVFDNGTYQLTTENYPFISKLRNHYSRGKNAFSCVIYFVRKAHSFEIKWGTDSPIQVRDKALGITTKLRCRGTYKIQITNPSLFLAKLIGNNCFCQTQQEINNYFITEFQSKAKSIIAKTINELDTEILGIDSRIGELSEIVGKEVELIVSPYGLQCIKFIILAIDIDDSDLRAQYDAIGIKSIEKIREAQADKISMDTLGQDWARLQSAKILNDLANNPNSGGTANIASGIGLGIGASNVFAGMSQQMLGSFQGHPQQAKEQDVKERFTKAESSLDKKTDAIVETLTRLKAMLDNDLITQNEYDIKKKEILEKI